MGTIRSITVYSRQGFKEVIPDHLRVALPIAPRRVQDDREDVGEVAAKGEYEEQDR